jgi:UDP-N-acetylmuramyl pentapeptide phosphotransferase/UDP-N-acetylglucosamine-1-phosphate transferase
MSSVVFAVLASACASYAAAQGLVLTASHHGRFTMDTPGAVQKVHFRPTPRVGGIGIYLALLIAAVFVSDESAARILHTLLVAGIPALAIGLLEDVTKRIGVSVRLAATVASGAAACWFGGLALHHLDIPGLDLLLASPALAVIFTAFSVAGVANAINIIDGFNGLASGTTAISLCALAAIALRVGDSQLAIVAVVLAAAIVGFWLVNFPWGRLFLGDGGAYFAGFALAWLAVLLPVRNPTVSPWASLLICGYPVIEVLYSVARRWRSGRSPGQPDCGHLHSLIARRVVQRRWRGMDPTFQNSVVSVPMWICAAIPASMGVTFYMRTPWLVLCATTCLLLYHCLYRQVARL